MWPKVVSDLLFTQLVGVRTHLKLQSFYIYFLICLRAQVEHYQRVCAAHRARIDDFVDTNRPSATATTQTLATVINIIGLFFPSITQRSESQ